VASVLPLGTRYNAETNNLVIEQDEVEGDRHLKPDLRTFTIIQDVANSIWPEIQWTMDIPSNHNDGMMPMLDTQVGVRDNEIFFEFYEKSKYSVLYTRTICALVGNKTELSGPGRRQKDVEYIQELFC
jgi:hypothetical protein